MKRQFLLPQKRQWSPARLATAAALTLLILLGLAASAGAQFVQPYVTITQIDSRSFPRMTAFVTVADQNGLPVSDLTAENFIIYENGVPVPPDTVTVEPFNLTERYLVLALDVSTYNDVLPQVQAAARAFVNSLGPGDRVSVVALYDEVEVLTDFTNNSQTLLQAIDGLKPKGNYTALNGIVEEMATLVEPYPVGHRALIILPDSKNNIAPRSPDAAIDAVQQVGVPLYLIGVKTKKIALKDLEAFATQTSGKVTVVQPDELERELLEIANRLPYGYRLTYQSQLLADDLQHDLTVEINYQGREGQALNSFVAVSRPVDVSLLGLTSGQTVGGPVDLSIRANAPAPLDRVDYAVDGRVVATVTAPPFSYRWDSTQVPAGPHAITVTATDRVGNQGQAGVDINVVPPVTVDVSSSKSEAAVGDQIIIQAQVATLEPLSRVDLLVDGVVIDSRVSPPFSFAYDSSTATVGLHQITVKAVDLRAQSGQDSLTIQFFPAWKERLRTWLGIEDRSEFEAWLQFVRNAAIIVAATLLILLLFIVAFLLLAAIRRAQIARMQQRFGLAVMNLGNIASRYQLAAIDEAGTLQFNFMLHGQSLHQQDVTEVVQPAAGPVAEYAATAPPYEPEPTAAPPKAAEEAAPQPPAKGQPKSQSDLAAAKEKAGKAAEGSRKAMGFSTTLGNILTNLARILPKPLARPLQTTANTLRRQRAQVQQATRMPRQISKTTKNVQRQAAAIKPKGFKLSGSGSTTSRPAAATTTADPAPAVATTAPPPQTVRMPVRQPVNGRSRAKPVARTKTIQLARPQTPTIAPGETLVIDLLIKPANPFKRRRYPFTVQSTPLDQPGAEPLIEQAVADIKGISWFARFVPALLFLLIAMFISVVIILVAAWLLGVDLAGYLSQISCFISRFIPGLIAC